jgi:hypothetical protein
MRKPRPAPVRWLSRKIQTADVALGLDRILSSRFFQNKLILWFVIVGLSVVFVIQALQFVWVWNTDSPSYYLAARGILRHVNIYDDQQFQRLADDVLGKARIVYPYIYWPFLAQLFTPFSALSIRDFFVVFHILNMVFAFLGLFLVYELLGLKESKTDFPIMFLFFLLVANVPLLSAIEYGQINLLVLDLILLSLILLKKNRVYLSSVFLCGAVLIKIYPVLFLFVFLFQKRYKYLMWTALNGLGILLLSIGLFGKAVWVEFVKSGLKIFSGTAQSPFTLHYIAHINNNTLKSFFLQLVPSPPAALEFALSWLTPVLLAGFLIYLFLAKTSLAKDDFNFGTSIILMAGLFISPITWFHHFVIMLFPLAYVMSRIVRQKRYGYLLPFCLLGAFILYNPLYGGFPFNQLRLFASLGFLLMLLHFGYKLPKDTDRLMSPEKP